MSRLENSAFKLLYRWDLPLDMKCLTLDEVKLWDKSLNLKGDRDFSSDIETKAITFILPENAFRLSRLSVVLVEWLPPNVERVFYFSDWPLYTPEQMILFNKVRNAAGEFRHLIDAPGHWFDGQSLPGRYETEDIPALTANPILQETATLAGLVFLAMAFQWHGYILIKNCPARIYLGDEMIIFFSDNADQLSAAEQISKTFNLKN